MSTTHFTNIESERLILRQFTMTDLELFFQYRSKPEVAEFQLWESFTEQEASAFIEKYATTRPGIPGEWSGLAIELKTTGTLIGDCAMKINTEYGAQAEIGFNLSPEYQGQGFATEAVRCLIDYVFSQIGVHRVFAVTDAENTGAANLLKRLGMRQEGHFIQNIWFKGRWGDEDLYAILHDEWC